MQEFICGISNSVGSALKYSGWKTICPKRHLMTSTSAQKKKVSRWEEKHLHCGISFEVTVRSELAAMPR